MTGADKATAAGRRQGLVLMVLCATGVVTAVVVWFMAGGLMALGVLGIVTAILGVLLFRFIDAAAGGEAVAAQPALSAQKPRPERHAE